MTNEIILLAFGDAFYNPFFVAAIFFLLFFVMYFQVLIRTVLGRGDNRKVSIVISFVLSILTIYGIFVEGLGFIEVPFIDMEGLNIPIISELFQNSGLLGLLLALLGIAVIYVLAKSFVRFFKINWGIR